MLLGNFQVAYRSHFFSLSLIDKMLFSSFFHQKKPSCLVLEREAHGIAIFNILKTIIIIEISTYSVFGKRSIFPDGIQESNDFCYQANSY